MKIRQFLQLFIIAGLVALNVGTFNVTNESKKNSYNAQLKEVWAEEGLARTAVRADNIYSIMPEDSSVRLDSSESLPTCEGVFDENTIYKAELAGIILPKKYEEKEFIRVRAIFKNVGDTAWYGAGHECGSQYPVIRLGSVDTPTAPHELWNDFNFLENNWAHNEFKNRVELKEDMVEPGGNGTFSFWIETPITAITNEVNVVKDEETEEEKKEVKRYQWAYEKYTFTPVIGEKWLPDAKASFILKIGDLPPKEEAKTRFLSEKLDNYKLKDYPGEKNIYLRLSDQTGFMRYGDKSFYSYKISSGAWDTKTPTGDHKVYNKQELRIGGKSPYYRMPYWMGLNINGAPFVGYGLHEVPYLGQSRETSDFYARGLKYDLGKNVSHGCVRSSDEDAPFIFEFGELGMPVYVRNKDDEKVYATIEAPMVKPL